MRTPVTFDKELQSRRLRPGSEAADGDHFLRPGTVDHHWRNAGHVNHLALQHGQGYARGNPGIDGIAPRFQDRKTRLCRHVMPGGDPVPGPHNFRPPGGH